MLSTEDEAAARRINAQPWVPLPGMIKIRCEDCDFWFAAPRPVPRCVDCELKLEKRARWAAQRSCGDGLGPFRN